ncbi:MAG: hypothetical protein ACR2KU_09850 [Gammaproteobacteria bacterium]
MNKSYSSDDRSLADSLVFASGMFDSASSIFFLHGSFTLHHLFVHHFLALHLDFIHHSPHISDRRLCTGASAGVRRAGRIGGVAEGQC